MTSRPVTQALPPEEVQSLNRALLRLAKQPRSMDALLEAGNAAVAVGDLDAAVGFFGRARELEPDNPKVALGLASVYLRSGRPATALPLFAAAGGGGAKPETYLSDQALALDMVGDQAAAQAAYTRYLEAVPDDTPETKEARRRLALSYAISGNSAAFETTLRPLVERRDFPAFRARAFGLAIMGEQSRAAAIVDAVMPRALATRITPYLEFMPRLTKAQQAAAANLGVFPRAAEIGRDTPEIAAYVSGGGPGEGAGQSTASLAAATPSPERTAGNRLEPAGEQLGAPTQATVAEVAPTSVTRLATATPAVRVTEKQPALPTTAPTSQPPVSQPPVSQPPVSQPPASEPSVSLPAARVADAFGDLLTDPAPTGDTQTGTASGAVDLAAIEIPREDSAKASSRPEPKQSEPEKPANPRRIWVQLATGRDLKALSFDWRRFSRKAPRLLGKYEPHTVPWGQANRLLAGPVESPEQARDLVNALKQKGVETFSYTSPEGTEIQQLK
ncbi:MAG: tetratricopeptide repeat protein [Erythrobacter sp.]